MKTEVPILEQSDEQILQTAEQLRVAYKLKRTLRYNTERDFTVHSESVAEHLFALFFLAQYFLPLEDTKKMLNVERVYRIILYHDFGEIIHGDVPYHLKTKEHENQEREDAKEVFASLPPQLQAVAQDSWDEYEQHQSPEARFVYALDKVEPLFELLDPVNERSLKRLKHTYQHNIQRKLSATEEFPIMRKFVEVITADMLKRGVFWVDE